MTRAWCFSTTLFNSMSGNGTILSHFNYVQFHRSINSFFFIILQEYWAQPGSSSASDSKVTCGFWWTEAQWCPSHGWALMFTFVQKLNRVCRESTASQLPHMPWLLRGLQPNASRKHSRFDCSTGIKFSMLLSSSVTGLMPLQLTL